MSKFAKLFEHEILRYLVVGGGAVVIDFISYMTMVHLIHLNTSFSKGTSYVLGALFSFIINKIWTFASDKKTHEAFIRFAILYTATFLTNVAINALVLWLGAITFIGFSVATATSIVLNYIGQKYWVFKGDH